MTATTADPSTDVERQAIRVDLYPTVGRSLPGESAWQVAVTGRVVRPWNDNIQRRLVQRLLRRTMRISPEQMQSPLLQERLANFWIRPCRNHRIRVQIEGVDYALRKRSRGSGHFLSHVRVPFDSIRPAADQASLIVSAVNGLSADRQTTIARLISPCGTSVISDIDDTIKVSEVSDRRQLFANSFLNEYQPVPGMSEVYRGWQEQGCEFHYVSSSPWQLFRPLDSFVHEHEFPDGSFHLRPFRLRDPNNFRIKLAGTRSKRKAIRNLLKWFPFRQFVLVGDGGEKDAKLYTKIARKHGHQIAQICIRRLPNATAESEQAVLNSLRLLPQSKWRMFEHGSELTNLRAGSKLGWNLTSAG